MPKMIQLRNVPDALHRRLKAIAASEGLTLSDFLTREAKLIAERPTKQEFLARLRALPVRHLKFSPSESIREERDRLSGDDRR
jgi:plasmid stability protein